MKTMKAVFLDRGTFPERIQLSQPDRISEWVEFTTTDSEQRLVRCQNAQIILTNKVIMDRALIEQLPELRLICVTATGVNNVDLEACRERGIQVTNAADYGTQSVSEHVLMLMLALNRNLASYLDANRSRSWSKSPFFSDLQAPIHTLAGKQLTIVGRGTLGSAVSRLAQAFGMTVRYAEHRHASEIRPGYTDFDEALSQGDFVSLHCPLTAATENLIRRETLMLMKPGACLINTGRGGLINERDLYDALQSKVLAGAALDVTRNEPPAEDDFIWTLAELPNVLCTPHIAWAADESMQTLINQVLARIEAFCDGRLNDSLV